MGIRWHANFFWGLVRRWPRATLIAIGTVAVFYFLYYAGVEALSIPESLAAAAGMALMCVFLKTAWLLVFYRFTHHGSFDGSFLLAAVFVTLPLVPALGIAIFLAIMEGAGPPAGAIVPMLAGAALVVGLTLGVAAKVSYWIWGGGLRRRETRAD
jgi:hypothetical protein